mgnify:CR=1 FL=1
MPEWIMSFASSGGVFSKIILMEVQMEFRQLYAEFVRRAFEYGSRVCVCPHAEGDQYHRHMVFVERTFA